MRGPIIGKRRKLRGTVGKRRRRVNGTVGKRRKAVYGKRRRKTSGPVMTDTVAPVGKGRKRRSTRRKPVYTKRGMSGRRKRSTGLLGGLGMFNVSSIMTDVTSILSIVGGFYAQAITKDLALSFLGGADKVVPYWQVMATNAGTYALAHWAEGYFRPSGIFSNILFGAKIGAIMRLVNNAIELFTNDNLKIDTPRGAPEFDLEKSFKNASTLGGSMLVDETGEVYSLDGPVKSNYAGGSYGYGDTDYSSSVNDLSKMDNAIKRAMGKVGASSITSMINAHR